jgi:hypothetical protein
MCLYSYDITLQVEPANDPDESGLNLHQRDGSFLQQREILAIISGDPGQNLPLSEQPCLVGSEG